ncbi:MAG: hypothetical protein KatS3mg042_0219 [Rhodothermaceae bacterium]|nr:MAG: hypothetical protein KatS3mg042_0219 [Rhodothermaceae bacterium]
MIVRVPCLLLLCLSFQATAFRAYSMQAAVPPTARDLLHAWLDAQETGTHRLAAMTFTERARRRSDGPTGTHTLEVESVVQRRSDSETWDRQITVVRIDGHTSPYPHLPATELAWQAGRPELGHLTQAIMLPRRLLDRLDVSGPLVAETVDGIACWRFDGVPADPASPIERITFWFTREGHHLLQTRVLLHEVERRGRRDLHTRLDVWHTYTHLDGLDVPVHRRFQGTRQYVRRGRLFTDVVTFEAHYAGVARFDR